MNIPPLLGITANQIEQWADHNIRARSRFSVLLRTLVHSTGSNLSKVDFPGNDDSERPGWDGIVTTKTTTPWIPMGISGWEFGTNVKIRDKANNDFEKNVNAIDSTDRQNITFVFVTPRRWPQKNKWIQENNDKKLWKDVRAYDASDIEQWLEQSLSGQVWFANEIGISSDVYSLDKCWRKWSEVSSPSLVGELFNSAIEEFKNKFISYFNEPIKEPLIVTADSHEEALAFLSQIFSDRGGNDLVIYRDRVLIFSKTGTLPRLSDHISSLIPVVFSRKVEQELAPYANSIPSIIVYPHNTVNITPHIVLEPLDYITFRAALEKMGKNSDEISRLERESGRSLTVLRRRIAAVPSMQIPDWVTDPVIAMNLIPFFMVGAWNCSNESDKAGLALLSGGHEYVDLEKKFQNILLQDNTPVWSTGSYCGVISKIDILYAIAGRITRSALDKYFSIAELILSEDDPALDVEEDKRWMSSIHGKIREFSPVFRKGISETLVLLAVHSHLFKDHLGIDTGLKAQLLIRELLTPLTTRVLEANASDLQIYAEVAPDEFLSIFEKDLKSNNSALLNLMRPCKSGVLGHSPSYTNLLWALEGLSWNPETLPRAVFILAQLAEKEPKDNWLNKPSNSLKSIFRAWMPQTAASQDQLVELIKELFKKFPLIAWKICIDQFSLHNDVGSYTYKPHWRTDGYRFGQPITSWETIDSFKCSMVELALNRNEYHVDMLSDLVDRIEILDTNFRNRIWGLIETWGKDKASDFDKAVVREKIRISMLSLSAIRRRSKNNIEVQRSRAEQVYEALEPNNVFYKYEWLFRGWVDLTVKGNEDIKSIDYEEREIRIQEMQIDAMRSIYNAKGVQGFLGFTGYVENSYRVGFIAATYLLNESELVDFLQKGSVSILNIKKNFNVLKNALAGAIRSILDEDKRGRIIKTSMSEMPKEHMAIFLTFAPFDKKTWTLVDELEQTSQSFYWKEVTPYAIDYSSVENEEGIRRLLEAKRPRVAFVNLCIFPNTVSAQLLYQLLSAIIKGESEEDPKQYLLEQYQVDEAFKHLDKSNDISFDQKVYLEFSFSEILTLFGGSYGIPNLERYIELSPEVFVQFVVYAYKRSDNADDPEKFQIQPEFIPNLANRSYELLEFIRRIPGHDEHGELQADVLAKWIDIVRKNCLELSRSVVGDQSIGKLLAHAPVGEDKIWPCEAVREVLEDIQSESMMNGMCIGVYNSRGVYSSSGGTQEKILSEKYRNWSEALRSSHPFISSYLLMRIAKSYEDDAQREVRDASTRRRLLK